MNWKKTPLGLNSSNFFVTTTIINCLMLTQPHLRFSLF